jgi:hypothetical protein
MSSREFSEWMAFYLLEPWGWQMDNWRSALVASTMANTARDTKKKKKPFAIEDFMPKEIDIGPRGRAVDQDVLRAKLDAAMLAWGGRKPQPQGAV